MKGPFGMLLIGGGIVLIVGLFLGKISFPGTSAATLSPADQSVAKKGAGGVSPVNGQCPSGYQLLGGLCFPNSVLGQI